MLKRIKDLLKKIKARLFPPSSRSFHGAVQELSGRMAAMDKKLNRNFDLLKDREKYNEAMSYVLLHQGMEQRLRDKVRRGGKVKVFFIVQYIAKFECKSVYDAMEKSELFEPYVLVTHPRDAYFAEEPALIEETRRSYQIMTERGYRTILGYDEQWHPIQLELRRPDIIFWNNPNMSSSSHYQNIYLNANYLTCYTPYFFNTSDLSDKGRFAYNLENFQIMTTWKSFAEGYSAFYEMVEKGRGLTHIALAERPRAWINVNAVLSGYPKLDPYGEKDCVEIPDKINNGKPIVIYAPHWSVRCGVNLSTFHLFNRQFLQLVHEYPGINFVFKPHPDLRNRIVKLYNEGRNDTLTPDKYDAYVKEWDSLPNGMLVEDGEYIDLFKASTCLITDSGSFIAEYLPSGHPCIYILNPEKDDPLDFYNELGRKMVESYYCCSDWETIEAYFEQVVIRGEDPNRELRRQIADGAFVNIGTAGQFICDYLENLLTE